jgi:hypothetical protein
MHCILTMSVQYWGKIFSDDAEVQELGNNVV